MKICNIFHSVTKLLVWTFCSSEVKMVWIVEKLLSSFICIRPLLPYIQKNTATHTHTSDVSYHLVIYT